MGQPEFGSGLSITARPSGDFEDTQGVERRRAMHSTREENRQYL
jgi:hypothetical protein